MNLIYIALFAVFSSNWYDPYYFKMDLKNITVISVLFYSSVLENCQISNWLVGGFTFTCHFTSIFGYNCIFLHGFALAFIISQTYLANNYNTNISVASRRNLGKLVSAGGLGGPKVELWQWFSKYKTNNTCTGLKCILFILNVEIS